MSHGHVWDKKVEFSNSPMHYLNKILSSNWIFCEHSLLVRKCNWGFSSYEGLQFAKRIFQLWKWSKSLSAWVQFNSKISITIVSIVFLSKPIVTTYSHLKTFFRWRKHTQCNYCEMSYGRVGEVSGNSQKPHYSMNKVLRRVSYFKSAIVVILNFNNVRPRREF